MSKSEDGISYESFLIKQLNMWVFTCMNIGLEDIFKTCIFKLVQFVGGYIQADYWEWGLNILLTIDLLLP